MGPVDYDPILPELFVGSYPESGEEIDQLKQETGITAVLSLQTDEDLGSLQLDWPALEAYYKTSGIELRRVPVRDFDPEDLQAKLPECVRALDQLLSAGHSVFLHCTAGAGRSPTVAIAYLHWCRGWDLGQAAAHVKACRPCSPSLDAIRSAAWTEPAPEQGKKED